MDVQAIALRIHDSPCPRGVESSEARVGMACFANPDRTLHHDQVER